MTNIVDYLRSFQMALMDIEDQGLIEYEWEGGSPLSYEDKEASNGAKQASLPSAILDCYEKANGFRLHWHATERENISGFIHFLKMQHVIQDWKKVGLFNEEDVLENDLIEYYKPFDQISETFSCGILITPDFVSESIYCHNAPDPETYDLDIDFEGYLEMAFEAKVFQYWPKTLLDIKDEGESPETVAFKREMPRIFAGFNWNAYVKRYQELRLSKRSRNERG